MVAMKILDVPQSGSLAGSTSSRNRFGQYRRTRATPVNPNTSFQQAVRAGLATSAVAWKSLTDAQRAQWLSWAEAHPRTDSLGQTYTLTGFQAYVSVNQLRVQAGESASSAVPTNDAPAAPTIGAVTVTTAAATVAYTPSPVPAGTALFIRTSGFVSPGVTFPPQRKLVQVEAAAATTPADIFDNLEARWGTPVEDRKLIVEIAAYEDGMLSGWVQASAIVTAAV